MRVVWAASCARRGATASGENGRAVWPYAAACHNHQHDKQRCILARKSTEFSAASFAFFSGGSAFLQQLFQQIDQRALFAAQQQLHVLWNCCVLGVGRPAIPENVLSARRNPVDAARLQWCVDVRTHVLKHRYI